MQIVFNVLLYALLVYGLYHSIVVKDYWYAFVIAFVIAVSAIIALLSRYHASDVSPGEYPYED